MEVWYFENTLNSSKRTCSIEYTFGSWEKQDAFEFHVAKPSIKYKGPLYTTHSLEKMANTLKSSLKRYPGYCKFNLL